MKHGTTILLSTLALFLTIIACNSGQAATQTGPAPTEPDSVTPAASRPQPNPPPS
ncbi:MAG: hypothetical protein WCC12_07575 [Anaerolineales bacterium]